APVCLRVGTWPAHEPDRRGRPRRQHSCQAATARDSPLCPWVPECSASHDPTLVTSAADRSWAVFPAGSPGEYNLPRELTLVLARGAGATVWDTDGRAFTDFTMGWGSVLLGH